MLCPECETRIKSLEKLKVDEDRRERAKKYVDETVAASKEAAEEERKKIEAEEERRRAAEAKKKAEDEAAAAAADAEAKDGEKADKKPEIKEEDLKPNEEELFPARPEEVSLSSEPVLLRAQPEDRSLTVNFATDSEPAQAPSRRDPAAHRESGTGREARYLGFSATRRHDLGRITAAGDLGDAHSDGFDWSSCCGPSCRHERGSAGSTAAAATDPGRAAAADARDAGGRGHAEPADGAAANVPAHDDAPESGAPASDARAAAGATPAVSDGYDADPAADGDADGDGNVDGNGRWRWRRRRALLRQRGADGTSCGERHGSADGADRTGQGVFASCWAETGADRRRGRLAGDQKSDARLRVYIDLFVVSFHASANASSSASPPPRYIRSFRHSARSCWLRFSRSPR